MSIWSVKIKIGTYNPKLPNRQNCQIWGILGHFRKKNWGGAPGLFLGDKDSELGRFRELWKIFYYAYSGSKPSKLGSLKTWQKNIFGAGKCKTHTHNVFLYIEEHTSPNNRFWEGRMFPDFRFLHFPYKFTFFCKTGPCEKKTVFQPISTLARYVSKSWVIFVKRTPFFALGLYGHIQWRYDPAPNWAQPGTGSGGLKKGLEGPKMTQRMKNWSFSLKQAYYYA